MHDSCEAHLSAKSEHRQLLTTVCVQADWLAGWQH